MNPHANWPVYLIVCLRSKNGKEISSVNVSTEEDNNTQLKENVEDIGAENMSSAVTEVEHPYF